MTKRMVIVLALVLVMCIAVVGLNACNLITNSGNGNTPTQPTFVDEVNEFVGGLRGASKLEKVVGIYVKEGCLMIDASYDGKLHALQVYFYNYIQSIQEGLDNKENIRDVKTLGFYETVPYDSASALLQSNDFGQNSQMQTHIDQGYTMSVVASQTVNGSNDKILYIYPTYKLTKGQETKYIQQVTGVVLNEVSNSQEKNYIESVRDPNARTVRERSFVKLTGDAYTFAEMLDAQESK